MSTQQQVDCVVIGAGLIGISIAKSLSMAGHEVILLESHETIGNEISARNSEVIHAGIYYPPNSLKAKLCVQGKAMLYEYCQSHNITHKRIGKLLVANSEEEHKKLEALKANAEQNGVNDLVWLDSKQASDLEPNLSVHSALLSPSTGIVNAHALLVSMLGDAEKAGTMLAVNSRVIRCEKLNESYLLSVIISKTQSVDIEAKHVINCAGLSAPQLLQNFEFFPKDKIPKTYLCKGSYFIYGKKSPFSHLVYPVPNHAGLGVHSTLDLGGQTRFGPDTEWVELEDYTVDSSKANQFSEAISQYFPGIRAEDLQPGYAGIRPKISGPNEPAQDFLIQTEQEHGCQNLINCLGIESPGLTASLAIGDYINTLVP